MRRGGGRCGVSSPPARPPGCHRDAERPGGLRLLLALLSPAGVLSTHLWWSPGEGPAQQSALGRGAVPFPAEGAEGAGAGAGAQFSTPRVTVPRAPAQGAMLPLEEVPCSAPCSGISSRSGHLHEGRAARMLGSLGPNWGRGRVSSKAKPRRGSSGRGPSVGGGRAGRSLPPVRARPQAALLPKHSGRQGWRALRGPCHRTARANGRLSRDRARAETGPLEDCVRNASASTSGI